MKPPLTIEIKIVKSGIKLNNTARITPRLETRDSLALLLSMKQRWTERTLMLSSKDLCSFP